MDGAPDRFWLDWIKDKIHFTVTGALTLTTRSVLAGLGDRQEQIYACGGG